MKIAFFHHLYMGAKYMFCMIENKKSKKVAATGLGWRRGGSCYLVGFGSGVKW